MDIAQHISGNFKPLKSHPEQQRLIRSKSLYNVVPAGRRSGKTEIEGKRKFVIRALLGSPFPDPRYFVAAPTVDQVRRIYWDDLKKLTKPFWSKKPNESRLIIYLNTSPQIHLLGMDKPERVEGSPWDGGVLDEYGNMKEKTWPEHVRPALSDRNGWCSFIGVPEGRNHYYNLYKAAQERCLHDKRQGRIPDWDTFHWISADILTPEQIKAAKRDLDELTYLQEYEASFVIFTGLAYYNFNERNNCARLEYNPKNDLNICFDFNVSPGVAVICQEQKLPNGLEGTGIIGEVYIPKNSNTVRVCDKIIKDWGKHEGDVWCYGDFTGGSKGTAKILGTDWELIQQKLEPIFGDRLELDVPKNPRERDRVNSVNSRVKSMSGEVKLMVDPSRAPWVVKDFEGVRLIEGGTGDIDKNYDKKLTHLTDAIGYYIHREFPVGSDSSEGDDNLIVGGL